MLPVTQWHQLVKQFPASFREEMVLLVHFVQSISDLMQKWALRGQRFMGCFMFTPPVILITQLRKEILCNHKSTWICRLFLNYCYEWSLIFFPRRDKYRLNLLCVWCIGGIWQVSFALSLYCKAYYIYCRLLQWNAHYSWWKLPACNQHADWH